MNQKLSIGLKYGLIAGVFSSIATLFLNYSGLEPLVNLHLLFVDGLLLFLVISVAQKEFKFYVSGGLQTFGEGMSIGFFVYAGMAVFFALFILVFGSIDASFMEDYRASVINQLHQLPQSELDKLAPDFIEEQRAKIDSYKLYHVAMDGFVKKLLTGLIISPIVSVLFKKVN
jgi:hypothetical protein